MEEEIELDLFAEELSEVKVAGSSTTSSMGTVGTLGSCVACGSSVSSYSCS